MGTPHAAFDPKESATLGRVYVYPSRKGQTKPSMKKVQGNERADSAAKDSAKNGGRKKYGWTSLTHIGSELNQCRLEKLSMLHQVENQERGASRRGFYDLQAKICI